MESAQSSPAAICPFPFSQLFLNPSAKITPCCYLAKRSHHVGDFAKDSLEDIWNGEKMQALRDEFLTGNVKTCKKFIATYNCNLIRRDLLEGLELTRKPPFPMKRLDMMLNGHCNLQCSMCSVWKGANGLYTENGFWDEGPEKIFPYLEEIDIKGGEPFIQKDVYRLIDEVSKVNQKCRWHITTNGHYVFNEKLKSTVDKITIARLSVSIDSLEPRTFSEIRRGGDLSIVMRTLEKWVAYRVVSENNSPGGINCNIVVQRANWREVPHFISFSKFMGVKPFFIPLVTPEPMSIFTESVEEKLRIIDYYLEAMERQQDRVYIRLLRPLIESMEPRDSEQILTRHELDFERMKNYGTVAEIDI